MYKDFKTGSHLRTVHVSTQRRIPLLFSLQLPVLCHISDFPQRPWCIRPDIFRMVSYFSLRRFLPYSVKASLLTSHELCNET